MGETAWLWVGGAGVEIYENSFLSVQFCCKLKTIPKSKVNLFNPWNKKEYGAEKLRGVQLPRVQWTRKRGEWHQGEPGGQGWKFESHCKSTRNQWLVLIRAHHSMFYVPERSLWLLWENGLQRGHQQRLTMLFWSRVVEVGGFWKKSWHDWWWINWVWGWGRKRDQRWFLNGRKCHSQRWGRSLGSHPQRLHRCHVCDREVGAVVVLRSPRDIKFHLLDPCLNVNSECTCVWYIYMHTCTHIHINTYNA